MSQNNLPVPVGYHILVRPWETPSKIGSIVIPESRKKDEDVATPVFEVIAMGELAYKDESKFPSGPYCEVGDTIMIPSYAGKVRFHVGEGEDAKEYRFIDDDQVIARVSDPMAIRRNL